MLCLPRSYLSDRPNLYVRTDRLIELSNEMPIATPQSDTAVLFPYREDIVGYCGHTQGDSLRDNFASRLFGIVEL
ncbi:MULTISPECIES: hypothetical protein [unclassified Microcoleus]|uniref:hypothetical protein n=1 Tax=unclassified Microcoleus TaxID=2642155 RepID=UPI002FD20425